MKISESEWQVMKVLWESTGLTMKEISARLECTGWSYTTVRTLVNRLTEKGAIDADRSLANNFKYFPVVSEAECQGRETRSFLSRVFDGSVSMLVSTLTRDSNLTEQEQRELMALIEKMDESPRAGRKARGKSPRVGREAGKEPAFEAQARPSSTHSRKEE